MRTPDRASSPLAGCRIAYDAAVVRPGSPSGSQAPRRYAVGFAYVLSNPAMPGMVKVGYTTDLAEDRARKLYTSGVPLPHQVEFEALTSFPKEVEAAAHAMLEPHRVNKGREFYRAPPYIAIETVKDALLEAASIEKWNFEAPHRVRRGDRIALTTREGDVFVVLAIPHLLADRTEPVDLWQSHADGDLVELMGADPEYVAGLSDYDVGAGKDPVPFLDRDKQRLNGVMNGRERLVPGDRLLWLRPTAKGRACILAIFEMDTYCQVISRTWDLKVDPCGCPLLLPDLTIGQLPDGVVLATRAVMRMPVPRTWAPRNPAADDGWVQTAALKAPPEYWLAQLARRRQRARRRTRAKPAPPGQVTLWLLALTVETEGWPVRTWKARGYARHEYRDR